MFKLLEIAPQETEQYELGFKAELFKRALLTGAVFDIKQPLALLDENNIFRYGGTQRHRGAELTLAGNITNDLKVVVGGLYLNVEVDNNSQPTIDGQRPASVPKLQGNIYADYNLAFAKGLSINAGVYLNLNLPPFFESDLYISQGKEVLFKTGIH